MDKDRALTSCIAFGAAGLSGLLAATAIDGASLVETVVRALTIGAVVGLIIAVLLKAFLSRRH